MYRIFAKSVRNINQYEELVKVFLKAEEYELTGTAQAGDRFDFVIDESLPEYALLLHNARRDLIARQLYKSLMLHTGKTPEWGILTGIRPVKLVAEIARICGSVERAVEILQDEYLLSPAKAGMAGEICAYQREKLGAPHAGSVAVYIGIPFCPTRCMYCSFTSNAVSDAQHDLYMENLLREMSFVHEKMYAQSLRVESLYIGGGTPTALNPKNLDMLLENAVKLFSPELEFTLEAGRPDTINEEKLRIIKAHGVERISINPQTVKQETLDIIGRAHSVDQVYTAYETANRIGFKSINTDLIAGLPGERLDDFVYSLGEILNLGADNITVHTLAVKRSSKLAEMDREYHHNGENIVPEMLCEAEQLLRSSGYLPYYLYRQKNMSGAMENVGWCKDDNLSVYNVRIMEEAQSIIAMGAGGISKAYFPAENRLERYPNVNNYEIYCERIADMLNRKKEMFAKGNWK